MGLFRRPVTAIWPDFGRVSEIAEIQLRWPVSPFCCAFSAAVLSGGYFANLTWAPGRKRPAGLPLAG